MQSGFFRRFPEDFGEENAGVEVLEDFGTNLENVDIENTGGENLENLDIENTVVDVCENEMEWMSLKMRLTMAQITPKWMKIWIMLKFWMTQKMTQKIWMQIWKQVKILTAWKVTKTKKWLVKMQAWTTTLHLSKQKYKNHTWWILKQP